MYETLMEAVVAEENYQSALEAVKRNQGAAGIDRMTTAQLEPHLQANWWILKDKLLKGTYVPSQADRYRRCWPTSIWMRSTRNWRSAGTASADMRMTAIST
jgi:hypothetical protein